MKTIMFYKDDFHPNPSGANMWQALLDQLNLPDSTESVTISIDLVEHEENCPDCRGNGWLEEPCYHCAVPGDSGCRDCQGMAYVRETCDECRGTGVRRELKD